jgi:hypothetical protein
MTIESTPDTGPPEKEKTARGIRPSGDSEDRITKRRPVKAAGGRRAQNLFFRTSSGVCQNTKRDSHDQPGSVCQHTPYSLYERRERETTQSRGRSLSPSLAEEEKNPGTLPAVRGSLPVFYFCKRKIKYYLKPDDKQRDKL